ncbi:hypothetical protein [Pseudomonas sp. 22 E 5]|nr:hypothetical protein [Pseudomonas sp. 22 E 5]
MLRPGRTAGFPWMLNPHKQGLLVRRKADTRDLARHRPNHEAADFPGVGVGAQHLVIAHAGEVALVAVVAVGKDPQAPGLVEAETVGAVEHVLRVDVGRAALRRTRMHTGVAGHHKQVPGEGVGAVVIRIGFPAQNLPVDVFLARVRPAHRLAVFAAFGVIGKRAIHLAVGGADHDPFRAVHACGFHHTGGQARVDQHFGLAGEARAGVDAVFAVGEFDPFALALGVVGIAVAGIENRHVQGAVVEQVLVGFGVVMVDRVAADELVNKLATLVIAHVHHGAAITGFCQCGVFMFEAAQGGAFYRRGLRVERVDFHHPAVAIEFVGVLGHVEARVVQVPVDLAAGGHHAVALLPGVEVLLRVAAAEAVGEVLFAGQVSAPRGLAVGAVLEGAEGFFAGVVGAGFQPGMAGSGAAQADRRIAVDAAVVARVLHELPGVALAPHLNHRYAFAGLGLAHVFSRLRRAAMGVEVAVVGVFIVDGHQRTVVVAGEGEQAHAVVVVTELLFLGLGGAIAGRVEGRRVLVQRLAPTDQHRGGVTRRQGDGVAGGGGDAGKAQQGAGGGCVHGHCAAGEQVAAQEHRGTAQGTGADKTAAGEADYLFKVGGLVFF